MKLKEAATILKAMANIKRLEILINLSHHEMSVGALQDNLVLSQSALSQHLAILRKANIVQTRRSRQQIFYRLENKTVKRILNFLTKD